MKTLVAISLAFAAAATGCASSSGIIPTGADTFMISKQAASGFSGIGGIKTEAYQEASAHCGQQGKVLKVEKYNESQPPFIFGNFPRVELEFRCTSKLAAESAAN